MASVEELTQRLEEMEKRLKIAEDIEQIKQLHGRFTNAHAMGDAEAELACYAEDGIFGEGDNQMTGKAAIAKFLYGMQPKEEKPAKPAVTEGGFVVHPQITVDGDKATGHWVNYNLFAYTATVQSLFWMQAIEDVEYVRENHEWKIRHFVWNLRFGLPPQGS